MPPRGSHRTITLLSHPGISIQWPLPLLSTAHDGIDNVGRNFSISRKIFSKGFLKPLPRPVGM